MAATRSTRAESFETSAALGGSGGCSAPLPLDLGDLDPDTGEPDVVVRARRQQPDRVHAEILQESAARPEGANVSRQILRQCFETGLQECEPPYKQTL